MLRRILSIILIAWIAGFIVFAMSLPQPAGAEQTQGVVVLTGGAGRIERGLEVLNNGWARQMLVSGVDPQVKPGEFAAQFKIAPATMTCCITLGYRAFDTASNARETAAWLDERGYRSVRVVTSDWHLRRARAELAKVLPATVTVVDDAVHTQPSLRILMIEYHKLLFRSLPGLRAS